VAFSIVNCAFLYAVAVLLEEEALKAHLDAFGLIDALRHMGTPAALVVDRRHDAILGPTSILAMTPSVDEESVRERLMILSAGAGSRSAADADLVSAGAAAS
jgi:hypothetical protein